MKLLLKISTILLSFFLVFVALPAPSHAAFDTGKLLEFFGPFTETSVWTATDEFCKKRSSELMNLETWFSGKCGEDVKSSMQGEGVGFVDIVALQGLESLFSFFKPTHISFIDYIGKTIDWMMENSGKLVGEQAGNFELTPHPFQNTLAGGISKGFSYLLLTKPASSTEYIAYVSNNLKQNKIIENTYAADGGYGFQALSPILPIWKAFRNIAYMLFAVAFVMYGIMIMFRIRIDSKTAANITLAIPKLVSTLLLITFSYAIVGLLVDIMTVFMSLSIDILRVGEIITGYDNIFIKAASGQSNIGLVGSLIWNGIVGFLTTPVVVLNIILGGIAGNTIASTALLAGTLATPIGPAILSFMFVVFILALLFAYGKIFFSVLKAYVTIIINLIFSPIIILGNVFPGSNAFSSWIMTVIGNLAVFPVITFFLVLSYALMMQPLANILDGFSGVFGVVDLSTGWLGFWTPPMTSALSTMVGGASGVNVNSGAAMLALIGLMLLFMASKYADMVLDALKVPPFKYGSAIGDSLKWGWTKSGTVGYGAEPTYKAASNVLGLSPGKPFWDTSSTAGPTTPPATPTPPTTPPATPCLIGDSEISTPSGKVKISNIKKDDIVITMDENDNFVTSIVLNISNNKMMTTPLISITFDNKYTITGTPEHKLGNGKTFSDLSVGDKFNDMLITNIATSNTRNIIVYDIKLANNKHRYIADNIPVYSSI